jgi:hypothetical protein
VSHPGPKGLWLVVLLATAGCTAPSADYELVAGVLAFVLGLRVGMSWVARVVVAVALLAPGSAAAQPLQLDGPAERFSAEETPSAGAPLARAGLLPPDIGPWHNGSTRPLLAASLAANLGDFLTRPAARHEQFDDRLGAFTRYQFERPALLAAGKLAFGVILPELGARYLERRGKKTAATVLRVFAVVAPAYGTYTNVRGKLRRGEW